MLSRLDITLGILNPIALKYFQFLKLNRELRTRQSHLIIFFVSKSMHQEQVASYVGNTAKIKKSQLVVNTSGNLYK